MTNPTPHKTAQPTHGLTRYEQVVAHNAELTAQVATLADRNHTQERTIDQLWHERAVMQKRIDHSQAHIAKIEARNTDLAAQLTPQGIAERHFQNVD